MHRGYLAQRDVVCHSCLIGFNSLDKGIGVYIFSTERDTNVECTLYE